MRGGRDLREMGVGERHGLAQFDPDLECNPGLHGGSRRRGHRRRRGELCAADGRRRQTVVPASGTRRFARPIRQVANRGPVDAFVAFVGSDRGKYRGRIGKGGRHGKRFSIRRCRNRPLSLDSARGDRAEADFFAARSGETSRDVA